MLCFREDIANQLAKVFRPHQLAVELYEQETGKIVNVTTAYNQQGRWMMIDGKLCEVRRQKDFIPLPRPKAPPRGSLFVPQAPSIMESTKPEPVSEQNVQNVKIEG